MRKLNLTTIFISLAFLSAGTSSCGRECGFTGYQPTNAQLDFRDAQGRDLLSPATPGHYDTTAILQMNPELIIRITKDGPAGRLALMTRWKKGETTAYLKLSATDQDTIYTAYENQPTKCEERYYLTAYKYNGKLLMDTAGHRRFVIFK